MTIRRRRKDAVESRDKILDTARTLFKDCGVQSVSMHQIAQCAHVGQGTLYRHYAHKGDLCLALLKESAEAFLKNLTDWVEASRGQIPPYDILESVIRQIIDFTDNNTSLLTAVNSSKFISNNPFYQYIHRLVSSLVAELLPEDSPLDATLTSDIILAATSPALYMFERDERGYTKDQVFDAIRLTCLSGLRTPHYGGE
ncbi:TetR/AcrR family transcriptional regulator [Alicyclobacillus fastidiosus]|uniref:TetR/AcrR family transcriptional regulator n=1 Tax=Alicyclobacillus fastidiosus TaxID=392011 RepID=A0ABY6ZFC5_9BACL|nr:TetR/AcrR family transcriptional regulator [Alicyclobacillus fastidiosus]WAH41610.1 TetR/AcrR family transcriptional regulator [Alicyclobacillus fastidiosus]